MLKLYSYFRSSASYRVRIALHWKRVPFEYIAVHLIKAGGMQNLPDYRVINPMGHVPALVDGDFILAESMAIVQYLEDLHPEPRLFPRAAQTKARVMQLCEVINSGIQPLQNLKVGRALEVRYGLTKAASDEFTTHWIQEGLRSFEKLLASSAGRFAVGDEVTAVDAFVVPQCYAARRFQVKVEEFPHLLRVDANASALEAFQLAHPERQPDFQI